MNKSFGKRAKLMLLAAPGILAVAAPAYAQVAATQPADASAPLVNADDIIVTAQRTGAQTLQKTPLAIAALSGEQLQDRQVNNVKDLVQFAPSLQVSTSAADSLIFIRGVGTTNTRAGSDPDVTTQVDGVYIARPNAQLGDFVGVERVEILRGPQGTLYGRNAAGGTINVISRKPSDQLEGEMALTGGNYALVQAQGFISGPIVPGKLQVSLAGNYTRHDGYIENIAPGGHDIDSTDRGTIRGQIRFESGAFESITRGDYARSRDYVESNDHLLVPQAAPPSPLANSIVGDVSKVALNSPQVLKTHSGGVSEEAILALSPALKLRSLTAYRESHYKIQLDADNTELNSFLLHQSEDESQFSEELNVNYNEGPIAAVAGFFYMREKIAGTSIGEFYSQGVERGSVPNVTDHTKAVFAQGTYTIVPGLHATAGGRYTWEDKYINLYAYTLSLATGLLVPAPTFNPTAKSDYHSFTPKFGLDYQVNPNALVYVSATRGFKSGGFNYAAKSLAGLQFNPETIWSYEGGIKSDWLDHRLRINLSGFYYDYKGLQVQSVLSPGNVFISNAANAKIKGLEAEIIIKPVNGLTLSSNASYLHARYGTFTSAPVPGGLVPYLAGDPRFNPATTLYNASGNTLNYAPSFSTLQALQYDVPVSFGSITARGEFSYQSRSYFDATNVPLASQKAYGLFNLALGWRSVDSAWHAQVLVRNVADKQYTTSGSYQGTPAGRAGTPRTVTFTVSRKF